MPLPALLISMLATAAQVPAPPPIIVVGHNGPPFISPMGEPFRARTPGEDTLGAWFRQADRNHDGMLIAGEMQADAERFFAKLDTNHDGEIDPDELVAYEWQVAPEIQVGSRLRRARAAAGGQPGGVERDRGDPPRGDGNGDSDESDAGRHGPRGPDRAMDEGPQGAARYALLNIPEPVAAADADFNRAISLREFREAAIARFQLLDTGHTGMLSLAELEGLLPKLPPPGAKPKHAEGPDTRVGNPLPKEN